MARLKQLQSFDQALAYSLRLISQRAYSEGRLRRLLVYHQTSPEHIAAVIARLRGLNLLDDQRYATTFARSEATYRHSSQRVIGRKLAERAIPPRIIEATLKTMTEELPPETERALFHARRYLQRHPRPGSSPRSLRVWLGKLAHYLGQKGFPAPAIRQVTHQLLQNEGNEV